jgi:hypothetical protein
LAALREEEEERKKGQLVAASWSGTECLLVPFTYLWLFGSMGRPSFLVFFISYSVRRSNSIYISDG